LAIAIAVVIPFITPIPMTAKPSEETLRFESAVKNFIDNDERPVMLCVDFGPQTMAEMEPILLALMHRLFSKKKKVVFISFLAEAMSPMRNYLVKMEEEYNLVYGEDYVFLGYASSFAVTMYGMGESIEKYYHKDDRGTPYDEIPVLKNVTNYKDISAVINLASNSFPKFWISFGVAPFGFNFLMACTAVQATDYFPFIQTGQVKGLIAGGKAGAEYEYLLQQKGILQKTGDATRGLGSQSLAIVAILIFLILGNIGHFYEVLKRKKRTG